MDWGFILKNAVVLKAYLCASLFIIGALVFILLENETVLPVLDKPQPQIIKGQTDDAPEYSGKVISNNNPKPEPEPEPKFQLDASELDALLQEYGDTFAVYYENIDTGYKYRRNADKLYFAASVIKAPYCMYVYKLAESGQADLSSVHTYTQDDFKEGSGKIQDMEPGATFTEQTLLAYTIRNSDNIALGLLVKKYGTAGFKEFVADMGGNPDFITTVAGAKMTADEAAIFAKEIYKYIEGGSAYSGVFKSDLTATTNRMIVSDYTVARKYGWWGEAFHDMAIVYAPSPYILVIMSESGHGGDFAAFKDISLAFQAFNEENFEENFDEETQTD